jgi:hypothetical protein
MTADEILKQARIHSGTIHSYQRRIRGLQGSLVMLQARVPKLREICNEAVTQGSVLKFCNSIILAHRKGAFGGREAIWDLMTDIASNMNKSEQGHRWKRGSRLIMQALYQHGGRRVVDCLASNMIGPSLITLQRDRRGMSEFRAGIHAEQFRFIAELYGKIKIRIGMKGPLPCYLAEDETCVKRTVRWLPKHDTLLGFCGTKIAHVCIPGLEMKVGEGDIGFNSVLKAFESNVMGHQARCIIVNPLHPKFPRLCLVAMSTCNTFDSTWVRTQWDQIDGLWKEICSIPIGPLMGHASDGDPRRRKLMLEDFVGTCVGKQVAEKRQNVGWIGWPLSHYITEVDDKVYAHRLHDQDYIHNAKKLINPLDSTAKVLKLGVELASISHLAQVFDMYSIAEHGLTMEDIKRTDRQNWTSAQRLCSRKVVLCLQKLRSRKDARFTGVLIHMCRLY